MKITLLLIPFILTSCFNSQVPECNSPDVLKIANEALQSSPLIKSLSVTDLKVGELKNAGEVEYDSIKDHRTCRAQVKDTDGSELWLKFKVSWHNKKENVIFVEFID